jgi:hypothetical protein
MASPSASGVAAVHEARVPSAEPPMTGLPRAYARAGRQGCALSRPGAHRGPSGQKTLREVTIDSRTRLDAWHIAKSGGRRG